MSISFFRGVEFSTIQKALSVNKLEFYLYNIILKKTLNARIAEEMITHTSAFFRT